MNHRGEQVVCLDTIRLRNLETRIVAWQEACEDTRHPRCEQATLNSYRRQTCEALTQLKRRCEAEGWPAALRDRLAEIEEQV